MNTNNVYYAKIYRLVNIETSGSNIYNLAKNFSLKFSRCSLVYQTTNNKFYDFSIKRYLKCDVNYDSAVGQEFVDTNCLIPFNELVNQTKENLSKRKIKKLYNLYQKQD